MPALPIRTSSSSGPFADLWRAHFRQCSSHCLPTITCRASSSWRHVLDLVHLFKAWPIIWRVLSMYFRRMLRNDMLSKPRVRAIDEPSVQKNDTESIYNWFPNMCVYILDFSIESLSSGTIRAFQSVSLFCIIVTCSNRSRDVYIYICVYLCVYVCVLVYG